MAFVRSEGSLDLDAFRRRQSDDIEHAYLRRQYIMLACQVTLDIDE
jgi:hypothetical protein